MKNRTDGGRRGRVVRALAAKRDERQAHWSRRVWYWISDAVTEY